MLLNPPAFQPVDPNRLLYHPKLNNAWAAYFVLNLLRIGMTPRPVAAALLCHSSLQIIPADLNAFMYQLERNIAWAANLTGNASIRANQNILLLYSSATLRNVYAARHASIQTAAHLCLLQRLQIIPADLNAFVYQLERNIAWAANLTGNASISETFNEAAAQRKAAIQALLWNNETGD
jgi:hypothetical protein